MEWLGTTADVIGILGALGAIAAWLSTRQLRHQLELEQRRQSRKVTVVLQYGSRREELPVEMRRAELTRSEVLGRLGMIPMKVKGQRFSLGYINTPEFLRQLNHITEGTGEGILTIPCTQEEFEQFDV